LKGFITFLKWFVGISLVLAIIVAAAALFLYPSVKEMIEKRAEASRGTEVRVEQVSRGRLIRTVGAPGVVEPRTKVSISSRVSAQIAELPYREGDLVREGDVVVRLEDKEFRAQVASAEASVRADEARLEGARAGYVNAVSEWERQKALFESSDVSKALLEQAEARRDQAESELRAAEHAIEVSKARLVQATENLRYTTMVSPINGRVTKLNAEVGEVVVTGTMNNAGTVIMEIADLSDMLVKAEVAESDIAPVRAGQNVRVYINAYPDETFEGTVERVALQHTLARDGTKHYVTEIRLHLADDRTVLRGLTANVDIEIETMEDVLLAPSQAVVDMRVDELPASVAKNPEVDQNKVFARVVYVFKDGKALARPVEIGSSDLTKTAIVAGVAENEEIIIGPWSVIRQIKNDQQVRRMEAETDAAQPQVAEGDKSEAEGGEQKPETASDAAAKNGGESKPKAEPAATKTSGGAHAGPAGSGAAAS